MAVNAFGHYVTHFSSRQSELWPPRPTRQPCSRLRGDLTWTRQEEGGKGVERDQEAGSVMMWQFMVSAFITNVILHHCWVAPRNPYIYEVYSKGLDEASVKGKVMFECMLCGDLFRSALRCGRKKKDTGSVFRWPRRKVFQRHISHTVRNVPNVALQLNTGSFLMSKNSLLNVKIN